VPLSVEGADTVHLGRGLPPYHLATIHQHYRQTRQTGEWSHSIGRTITCNGRSKTEENNSFVTRVRYLSMELYEALMGLRSAGTDDNDDDDSVFVVEFCRRRLLARPSSSGAVSSESVAAGRFDCRVCAVSSDLDERLSTSTLSAAAPGVFVTSTSITTNGDVRSATFAGFPADTLTPRAELLGRLRTRKHRHHDISSGFFLNYSISSDV